MVLCSKFLRASSRPRISKLRHKFLDQVRIFVRGGGGGQGLPKYGGTGGQGGDVYIKAAAGVTLNRVKASREQQRYVGGTGSNSKPRILQGSKGKDVYVTVPVGVCVTDDKNNLLGDLNQVGDEILVASGGDGGNKSNRWCGTKGQRSNIKLVLKLIADVGFVGFPNAGKSTLLKGISRTQPKIADYPFTTIRPQVGIVEFDDKRQISVADLPGLIEGSHVNSGMGHKFLRHIERTKLLLFVVDIHGFCLSPKHAFRSAYETVVLLNMELELYKPELMQKPAILALNKMDMEEADDKMQNFMDCFHKHPHHCLDESITASPHMQEELRLALKQPISFEDIIPISAKELRGLNHLQQRIRDVIDSH
ncbi:GTP-binding protein 10-like [Diadema antillarum]|uniref:GTP-binding protein 10-like n=1 Tax=Diadema antillarum TaxID=105358 RepID=UPI003A874C3A